MKGYWREKENREKPGRILTKRISNKCDVEEERYYISVIMLAF